MSGRISWGARRRQARRDDIKKPPEQQVQNAADQASALKANSQEQDGLSEKDAQRRRVEQMHAPYYQMASAFLSGSTEEPAT